MRRTLTAILISITVVGMTPSTASAHAALVDSNPTNGQRLQNVPELFSVTLNESVASPALIAIVNAEGDVVATEEAQIDDRMVSTRVSGGAELISGDYSMSYRLVSADGHAVSGSVDFEIDAPEEPGSGDEGESGSSGAGEQESPDDRVAIDVADDSDRNFSAALVAVALGILAILLLGVRRGIRSSEPTRHPDP